VRGLRDDTDSAVTETRPAVVDGGAELSIRTVTSFVPALRQHLEMGPERVLINLEDVKLVDVVGLAALLQATRYAAQHGTQLAIVPSIAVHHGALQASIAEDLPFVGQHSAEPPPVEAVRVDASPDTPTIVVQAGDLALRRPRWDDLSVFEQWAHDPFLKAMVGSHLLYRCRHLGPYHPEFAASVLHDFTSLTLIVQAARGPEVPLGFVRLYGIHLGQGFGFLESAIVSRQALRRGWGVAASRWLSFYAQDLLGIRRIEAKAYEYNRLSVNALLRNGFKQEGVLRQAAIHQGMPCDILVFGILDHEIRAQRRKEGVPYLGLWDGSGDPFFFEASDSSVQ
jgi:RimJ/RimL family protein N-acetyltransferase/ABC-type transporter Mla MlaB component